MPKAKLTDDTIDEICEYLRRGHLKRSACGLVGIHRDTLNEWEQRGRALADTRAHPPLRDDYPSDAAYRKARAAWSKQLRDGRLHLRVYDEIALAWDFGEGWLIEQVLAAAAGAPVASSKAQRWQAYMTILERTRRDQWRRSSSVEHGTPDGKPFPVSHVFDPSKLSTDELEALKALLERARPDDT